MIDYPPEVKIYEVGPRDGLQNESREISTAAKIRFVDLLSACGFRYIETSSFVHPQWIPQLADAEDVFRGITRKEGIYYGALVPNLKGMERALDAGCSCAAIFISASEAHNRKNINRDIEGSLQLLAQVAAKAVAGGIALRGYISMVFGCPTEGQVPVKRVLRIAHKLREMGCEQISFGDTVGLGTPKLVTDRFGEIMQEIPASEIALHVHDTRGTAVANVLAGMDRGVRIFDAATGGLGGCNYAPGATGNLPTEDIVAMLHSMGVSTGLDLDAILDAAEFIERAIGKRLPGRFLRVARGPAKLDLPPTEDGRGP